MERGSRDRDRRRTDERRQRGGGGRSRARWSDRLTLGPRPLKLHFQKPDKMYADRLDEFPKWGYDWLVGARYYTPSTGFIEFNPNGDVIEAYQKPSLWDLDMAPDSDFDEFKLRPYHCMSGWIEQWHHLIVEEWENEKSGKSGTRRVRKVCKGKRGGCRMCKSGDPKVFGRQFFVDFSEKVWGDVISVLELELERFTTDGDYLYPEAFDCEKCGEELFQWTSWCEECESEAIEIDPTHGKHVARCQDCGEEWGLFLHNSETLKERKEDGVECDACSHVGEPKPRLFWEGQNKKGTAKPKTLTLFDVMVQLRTQGEDTEKVTIVVNWEAKKADARLFDPKYQGASDDKEMADKIVNRFKTAMDLEAVHPLMSPVLVAKKLKVENPFAPEKQETKRRGRKDEELDEEYEDEGEEYEEEEEYEDYGDEEDEDAEYEDEEDEDAEYEDEDDDDWDEDDE